MTLNGERLRAHREDLGLSRDEVAHRADVSVSTVQRAERNAHATNIAAVARIAGVLGVPVGTLYDKEEGRDA